MYSILFRHIFAFLFSFILSIYLIPQIIKTAIKKKILDLPDNNLKVHKRATPYLGGVGVYLSFMLTLAIVYPFENRIFWFLIGITLLMIVGLIDDLKVLKPYQKLLGQFIAVACFLKNGFYLKSVFLSGWLNNLISGFWMLSVINAINLVDIMDGLATLLAVIATATFFVIAIFMKQYSLSLLILIFLGPLLGFFLFNKPQAKIYLGDTGSMFIGGFLAAIPLLFPWSSIAWDAYYAPVIILAVPLSEVGFLILIRLFKGIPFYQGSPHHFAIYLQKKGLSVWRVLTVTGLFSVSLSLVVILFLLQIISFWIGLAIATTMFLMWVFYVYLT